MKPLYISIIAFLLFTTELYAETDLYFRTDFDRGDVITVLASKSSESYTLELVDSSDRHITDNIFFPVDTGSFAGVAAIIGLDSTLEAGSYTLRIKKMDETILNTGTILIHENLFKKENISLNYNNTALRTDPDPNITLEAVKIHEIYNTSNLTDVTNNKHLSIPIQNGIITSWYGDRRIFIYSNGLKSNSIHNGIDFAAPFGTKITAGYEGTVVFAGERIITGNSVVVEYLPGVYGVYFHLNEYLVAVGDRVSENTILGTLGSSGLATGPHLHWEIRVGGVPVSPDSFIAHGLIDNSLIMSIVSSHTAE